MNSTDQPVPPDASTPETTEAPEFEIDLTRIAKSFLAGNPFYIASAVMLLYGISKVSHDARMDAAEEQQLVFNFTSLLCYEALLVVGAIGLARRRIWYDSTLLFGLENMFVFIPFILIGQAALIGTAFAWVTCLAAFACALAKGGSIKRFIPELGLSWRLLACGFMFLTLNLSVPLYYREIIEDNAQAWHRLSPAMWLLVLPALLGVVNLLAAKPHSKLWPEKPWIPSGLVVLWSLATAVHLRAVDYVDNIAYDSSLFGPLCWVLAWSLSRRVRDFISEPSENWRNTLLHLPLFAPLLAVSRMEVFFALQAANAAIYGYQWWLGRRSQALARLIVLSCMASVASMPSGVVSWAWPDFTRSIWLVICLAAQCLTLALMKREPKFGLIASIAAGVVAAMHVNSGPLAGYLPLQAAMVFALVHSLLWRDDEHPGATIVRRFIAVCWMVYSGGILFSGTAELVTLIMGASSVLIVAACLRRWLMGEWGPWSVLAGAATLVVLQAGRQGFGFLRDVPEGLLTVLGAFALFAAGTILAVTKPRWLKSEDR